MAALESIKSGSFKINAVLPEDVWDDRLVDIPERERWLTRRLSQNLLIRKH